LGLRLCADEPSRSLPCILQDDTESSRKKDLSQKDWVGDAAYLFSPGDDHINWPRFTSAKEAGNDSLAKPSKESDGPPAVSFKSWRGFALKGNESHMMRVSHRELKACGGATNIRKLMASNMTLEEIETEIRKEEGEVTYRGVLRISDDIYRLNPLHRQGTKQI
jgi:hypothetical protein